MTWAGLSVTLWAVVGAGGFAVSPFCSRENTPGGLLWITFLPRPMNVAPFSLSKRAASEGGVLSRWAYDIAPGH